MSYILVKPDELYHYGILGQKWGIRRFQNPDGSLTEAGKKRYANSLIKEFKKDQSALFGRNEKIKSMVNNHISSKDKEELLKLIDKYNETLSRAMIVYDKFERSNFFKTISRLYDNEEDYESTYTKAFNDYLSKNPESKKLNDKVNIAWDKIDSKVKSITENMLGEYKNIPIKQINTVGTNIGTTLGENLNLYVLGSHRSL